MPVNRNALIRYKTIDNCLRNKYRKWTLDDLIDACSEALYEYEGIDKGVSRRTVQMDIQAMRSEKLGYSAPIVIKEKKYYMYDEPDYTITNIPLTDQDLNRLTEVTDILRQFKGFTHFHEMRGMIQKLEDKIHVSKTHGRPIIDLEKNEHLKGLEYIDLLFQAISEKKVIVLRYKSFTARAEQNIRFHPALLKEFRNRWFVLGKEKVQNPFILYALDRIIELEKTTEPCMDFDDTTVANYFDQVIGVSVNQGEKPVEIHLFVAHSAAPYLLTKPLHHSQKLIERNHHGIIISLMVQINFELEREILGFGDNIKVLSPLRLRKRIYDHFRNAADLYDYELNEKVVSQVPSIIASKGTFTLNKIYTTREVNRINNLISKYKKDDRSDENKVYAIREVLTEIPGLKRYIFNDGIRMILNAWRQEIFLTKSIFFDKPEQANWFVTWHQDTTIHVKERIETEGYSGWTKKGQSWGVVPPDRILKDTLTIRIHLDDTTAENGALKVFPGSHRQKFKKEELDMITQNGIPFICEVQSGGVHIMQPLLLHASSKSQNQKRRRVLHLEFNHLELDGELKWAEKDREI
jgi:predicted DNA-binding transcriptional regulator YafY/ectoine hydroxylase-related dioxygenase (phytanoyl-CoA dioxygenase family)